MLKPPHNCTHLTRQQSNAQNSPSQASTEHELQTSALHNKDTEKDKNDMDLTKAEDIKNWQEHTVNYTKEI